jgi:hypothetical protein
MNAALNNSGDGPSQRSWTGLDVAAWRRITSRGIALLLILCFIKCFLLGGMAMHLYEEHWRIGAFPPTWLDYASYYLFVGLVPATLVLVGRRLPPARVGAIRGFNAAFILVGLAVVFLSFCRMKSNYLYPVMDGVLDLRDVWQYLKLDLFFAPPFLAAYLLGFALTYYILIRVRKEHYSFWILGGLASLYLVLNERGLILHRELLIINCLGVAGMVGFLTSARPLNWIWQVVPIGLVLSAWLLFGTVDRTILNLNPYFIFLLCIMAGFLVPACVLTRRSPAFSVLSPMPLRNSMVDGQKLIL